MLTARYPPFAALYLVLNLLLSGCHSQNNAIEQPEFTVPVIRAKDPDRAAIETRNNAVEKALQLTVNYELDLELEEVIQYVRKMSGQSIAVEWDELEIVGVEREALTTIHAKEMTLERLLRLALDQVSEDAFDDDKVGFAIIDGIICVSTLRNLKQETYYASYNVGWYILPPGLAYQWLYRDSPRALELLKLAQDRREELQRIQKPEFDLNDALSGTSSGGSARNHHGGGEGGLFGNETYEIAKDPATALLENRINTLIEMIQTIVGDPDEWLDEISTIQPLNDQFIIKTTDDNHKQVEFILSALYHAQVADYRHQAQQIEVFLLLDDAESYRFKQDYDAALHKVRQALRVDPFSPKALALKQVIKKTLSRQP